MEINMQEDMRAQAADWLVRLRHGGDRDWEAFADWLAEDPAHATAYDEVEQMDLAIETLLPDLQWLEAANDHDAEPMEVARSSRHWLFAGGALAACLAAAVVVLTPQLFSSRYDVATRPGETHIVNLDAGTRITLNGDTKMTFDRKDPRFAALYVGEAVFEVRHDSNRPFRLLVGDNVVQDAGTIFSVVRETAEVRVAVAEGRVIYNPGNRAISLDPGQALVDNDDDRSVRVEQTPVGAVGAWQRGQLIYTGEPLSRIAADLSRSVGITITVTPIIASRPFHGTIALNGADPKQLDHLKLALGVDLEKTAHGWIMRPAP